MPPRDTRVHYMDYAHTTRPDSTDMSSPKFQDCDAHVLAVLEARPTGFPVLAIRYPA